MHFGTDGVRGIAHDELTTNMVRDLGRAVAKVLTPDAIYIGRDTRESGQDFEHALIAGITAEGVAVTSVGVAPTPAVAFLSERENVAGIAITASHNPWTDNGIKVFAPGGTKLSDAQQIEIEREWHQLLQVAQSDVAPEPVGGTTHYEPTLLNDYIAHCVEVVGRGGATGARVVVDCANGAMSEVAPAVFAAIGADAIIVNASPNGRNINDGCGAMYPHALADMVRTRDADFGIAFDGDGDRIVAVTVDGEEIDGDYLLALAAIDLDERGLLRNKTVAVTVMTNIGFHEAMERAGIHVVVTPVGDRNILAALEEFDLVLGGEQSGHIIYRAHATTGDGLLAAMFLLECLTRRGTTLQHEAHTAMTRFPQVLINVRTVTKVDDPAHHLDHAVRAAEATLGVHGRVLVRASGTEPLIRVMVEAPTHELATQVAKSLADTVVATCGGEIEGAH